MKDTNYNYFWHNRDFYTITSKGFIWCFPGQKIIKKSVTLFPEKFYNIAKIKRIKSFTPNIPRYVYKNEGGFLNSILASLNIEEVFLMLNRKLLFPPMGVQ